MIVFFEIISCSEDDTLSAGAAFSKALKKGDVVLLNGTLGAGKTRFAKGLAQGLGIKDTVTSPTFSIMNVYYGGSLPFFHLDLYRIESADELFELGVEEYIRSGEGVAAIEWNKYEDFGGQRVFDVNIETVNDGVRRITVKQKASAEGGGR